MDTVDYILLGVAVIATVLVFNYLWNRHKKLALTLFIIALVIALAFAGDWRYWLGQFHLEWSLP